MAYNVKCLKCGGTGNIGTTAKKVPCPDCCKLATNIIPSYLEIPTQYQGLKFDKSFLPEDMQDKYGTFMEELLNDIVSSYSTYQKNLLICARPNCGKTVWAYNLFALMNSKGIKIPPFKDIVEVKEILDGRGSKEDMSLYSSSRFAIIKIPRAVSAWMFDYITYILERRVRSNGCTIFLYGGTEQDLKNQDSFGKLKYIKGTGSYNTVAIKSFEEVKKQWQTQ